MTEGELGTEFTFSLPILRGQTQGQSPQAHIKPYSMGKLND